MLNINPNKLVHVKYKDLPELVLESDYYKTVISECINDEYITIPKDLIINDNNIIQRFKAELYLNDKLSDELTNILKIGISKFDPEIIYIFENLDKPLFNILLKKITNKNMFCNVIYRCFFDKLSVLLSNLSISFSIIFIFVSTIVLLIR